MSQLFASCGQSIEASVSIQYGQGNSGAYLELQDTKLLLFKKTLLHWSRVALYCCVSFCYTAK